MFSLTRCLVHQGQLRRFYSYMPRTSSSSDKFRVRRLRTADEVAIIISKVAEEGWKPGALDHVSYFAADNTGFFVGELNGIVISCISAVKYSEKFAVIGNVIVDKPYRDRGFGRATRSAALASIPKGSNIFGDVYETTVETNVRVYGAKSAWRNRYATIAATKGSLALANVCPPENVRPASDVQFNDLLEYDTSIHLYSRPSFLHKWISAPNCFAFVATDNNGVVVGYTVVRTVLGEALEWKIGPLCADTSEIAKSLYKTVFAKVAAEDSKATIGMDVPFDDPTNPDALKLLQDLPTAFSDAIITRMYKYGLPSDFQLQKIFAMTSTSI